MRFKVEDKRSPDEQETPGGFKFKRYTIKTKIKINE